MWWALAGPLRTEYEPREIITVTGGASVRIKWGEKDTTNWWGLNDGSKRTGYAREEQKKATLSGSCCLCILNKWMMVYSKRSWSGRLKDVSWGGQSNISWEGKSKDEIG